MDLFGIDWSDGWAGNITAEALGLAGGILVTYLVAERVVRWRLTQERRPARQRLMERLSSHIRGISATWLAALGMSDSYDLGTSTADLEKAVQTELDSRFAPSPGITLDGLVARNLAAAGAFPNETLSRLYRGVLQELERVSRTADRFAVILQEDGALHGLVADLEYCADSMALTLTTNPLLERLGLGDSAKLGVTTDCKLAFDRAAALRAHIEKP